MDRFKLNGPVFDKDESAGGAPSPKTDDSAGAGDGKKAGEDQQNKEKTFSQKDVDQIVKERLEREHKKQEEIAQKAREEAEKKALEEQGEHKKLAEKAAKEAETAKAEKAAAETALKSERIHYAVLTKAMQMNFADPEDAIKMSDFSDLEFDEAGKPNVEMIGKKLDELVKAKPYLVKTEGSATSYGTPKKKDVTKSIPSKEEKRPGVPIPKF